MHSQSPKSAPGHGGLRLPVVSCWVLTILGVGVTLPPCSQRCGGSPLTDLGSRNLPRSQDGCLSSPPEPAPCHFSPLPRRVPSRMWNNCVLSQGEGDPTSGGSILGERAWDTGLQCSPCDPSPLQPFPPPPHHPCLSGKKVRICQSGGLGQCGWTRG